mgnify:CR=1 FL=1|tara:strand:+ start:5948 stop:6583 length:636 start_codon:yes stop_codon:yes gene_type:complete
MTPVSITRFFKFATVNDVEERIAKIFFLGILLATLTSILFVNMFISEGVVTWAHKLFLTVTYICLSIATVSTTALPYLWNKQSHNRFSEMIYFVFIFGFNAFSLGLVLLLAAASSPAGGELENRLNDVGFLDAAILIISTSIVMEIIADATAYFNLRNATNKQPFMGLILLVELGLIAFMTFGNTSWMLIDSTLILGFFLTIGHIVIHFSN